MNNALIKPLVIAVLVTTKCCSVAAGQAAGILEEPNHAETPDTIE